MKEPMEKLIKIKVTPEMAGEWAEEGRRELADALWRRYEKRKARRAARNSEWLKFVERLYAR
jgi:hypothetical protein